MPTKVKPRICDEEMGYRNLLWLKAELYIFKLLCCVGWDKNRPYILGIK